MNPVLQLMPPLHPDQMTGNPGRPDRELTVPGNLPTGFVPALSGNATTETALQRWRSGEFRQLSPLRA
jgi:hypothetical protein